MHLVPDADSGVVDCRLENGCDGGCPGADEAAVEMADHRQARDILSVKHAPQCAVWLAAAAYLSAGLADDD